MLGAKNAVVANPLLAERRTCQRLCGDHSTVTARSPDQSPPAPSLVARRSSLVAGAYSARSPTVRFFFRELATELAII